MRAAPSEGLTAGLWTNPDPELPVQLRAWSIHRVVLVALRVQICVRPLQVVQQDGEPGGRGALPSRSLGRGGCPMGRVPNPRVLSEVLRSGNFRARLRA